MAEGGIKAVWGDAFIDEKFTQIPNIIIDYQGKLGMTQEEFLLLIHVMRHQYTERLAFPSESKLARRMDVTLRTVQRISASMRNKGFLEKVTKADYVLWDFSGLRKKVLALYDKHGDWETYDKNVVRGYDKNVVSPTTEMSDKEYKENNTIEKDNTRTREEKPKPALSLRDEVKSKPPTEPYSQFTSLPDWNNPAFKWARTIAQQVIGKVTPMGGRRAIERVMAVCLNTYNSDKLAADTDDIGQAMIWWLDMQETKGKAVRTIDYIETAWKNPADTTSHPVGRWYLEKRGVPDERSDERLIAESSSENKNMASEMAAAMHKKVEGNKAPPAKPPYRKPTQEDFAVIRSMLGRRKGTIRVAQEMTPERLAAMERKRDLIKEQARMLLESQEAAG